MSRLQRLRAAVPSGLIGTVFTTGFVTLFGVLSNFLLARWMGPEAFGSFTYATAWILVLNIVSLVGMHNLVLRELAKALALESFDLAKGLINWSRSLVGLSALGVGGVFWLFSWTLELDRTTLQCLWVALLSLPFLSQVRLGGSILRSLDHIVTSQIPGSVIGPGLFVVLIIAAKLFFNLDPVFVVALYVASYGVAHGVTHVLVRRYTPPRVQKATPRLEWRAWLVFALPFLLTGGMHILNTRIDVIMLGLQRGTEAVGIYQIASRGADLVLLSLLIVNVVVAPTIAKFHALGNQKALQSIVTRGAQFSLLGGLFIAGVLALGAGWFLSLFGPAYVAGTWALLLLIGGNLFNVAAGPIVQILDMTNRATVVAVGFSLGIVLNVVLNLLLVPGYGINGAAIATMSSAVIWNLVLGIYVYTRLNINPTAFRLG